jgi:hypothetical protein
MKTTLNALAIALTVVARCVSAHAEAAELFSASVGSQSIINNREPHMPTSGLYSAARRLQAASVRGGGGATRCALVSNERP